MTQNFTYTTKLKNTIPLTLYGAEAFGEKPCIIYVHGFKGFKDWGFVPYIAECFAAKGFPFLTFNFSHNGVEGNGVDFTRLDLFEQNTHSLEVSELMEVIDLCVLTDFFGKYSEKMVALLGHSRGGGTAILAAAKHPSVAALATWAAVCKFDRYDKQELTNWKKNGYVENLNTRTGQKMRLGMQMYEDIVENSKDSLHILSAVSRFTQPYLIAHGDNDSVVHFYESEQLNVYAAANLAQHELISGGDHTFGAIHPFAGTNPFLEDILQKTIVFFQNKL